QDVPRGTERLLTDEGALADEIALLLEADRPADAGLDGRLALAEADGMHGADIVGIDENEARFDAGHVQRPRTDGRDLVGLAPLEQALPEPDCILGLNPQLVTEIAGIAGPVDAQPPAVEPGFEDAEMRQV